MQWLNINYHVSMPQRKLVGHFISKILRSIAKMARLGYVFSTVLGSTRSHKIFRVWFHLTDDLRSKRWNNWMKLRLNPGPLAQQATTLSSTTQFPGELVDIGMIEDWFKFTWVLNTKILCMLNFWIGMAPIKQIKPTNLFNWFNWLNWLNWFQMKIRETNETNH